MQDVHPEVLAWSESKFQSWLIKRAEAEGWLVYHTRDSRGSQRGYPDLTMCRPPRLVIAELKKESGRMKPEQKVWRAVLEACQGFEYYLWRPRHMKEVEKVLGR